MLQAREFPSTSPKPNESLVITWSISQTEMGLFLPKQKLKESNGRIYAWQSCSPVLLSELNGILKQNSFCNPSCLREVTRKYHIKSGLYLESLCAIFQNTTKHRSSNITSFLHSFHLKTLKWFVTSNTEGRELKCLIPVFFPTK